MATDDYGQSITIPDLTSPPDISVLVASLQQVLKRSVLSYSSASTRNATLTSPVEGMTTWLQDVNRIEVYNGSSWVVPPPVITTATTGLTAETGWSVSSFIGRRASGISTIVVLITRTGGTLNESSAGSGNLSPEPLIGTLPSAWRPPETINTLYATGAVDGEAIINDAGEITLRTISGNAGIGTNDNVRMMATWVDD